MIKKGLADFTENATSLDTQRIKAHIKKGFYGCWNGILRVLERYLTGAGTVSYGCWNGILRVLERYFTGAGTVFYGCWKRESYPLER